MCEFIHIYIGIYTKLQKVIHTLSTKSIRNFEIGDISNRLFPVDPFSLKNIFAQIQRPQRTGRTFKFQRETFESLNDCQEMSVEGDDFYRKRFVL